MIKKQNLLKEYEDLIEWLMTLYSTQRVTIEDDGTRLINQAFQSV